MYFNNQGMDIFLASIIFVSILVITLTVWLLHWLKANYPQSYNDPAMAGLGGFAGFILVLSLGLPFQNPYGLVIAAIPTFIIISCMSAGSMNKKIVYSAMSVTVVSFSALATYYSSFPSWATEALIALVFCILWVILFRWRYVHNQSI